VELVGDSVANLKPNGTFIDMIVTNPNWNKVGPAYINMNGYGDYYGELALKYTIVPQSPTNLHVSEVVDHSAKLTWAGAPGAGYYEIQVKEGNKVVRTEKVAGTSHTVTNLKSQTKYTFVVKSAAEVKSAADETHVDVYYGKKSLTASATTLQGAANGVYSIQLSGNQATAIFNGKPQKTDGSWNVIVTGYDAKGRMVNAAMAPVKGQTVRVTLANVSAMTKLAACVVALDGTPVMEKFETPKG